MSFLLTAFLCICLLPSAVAKAAEAPKDPTIEIPVEVTAEGSVPSEPETYVVRLTAVTDDAPMPDGASGDTAELSIQGPGEGAFSFTYRRTGVYQYKISQVVGTSTICEYDATVYDLYVYVTRNAEKERADAEKERADTEKERADAEKERADAEKKHVEILEEEIRELKGQIAKMHSNN